MHTLFVVLALVSGVQKGGKMYVKGDGVAMTAKADHSGASTPLTAGTEVTWLGPDEQNKSMHRVEVHGKKGFLPMSALTPNKPDAEIQSTAPPAPRTEGSGAEEDATLTALKALRTSTAEQKPNVAEHAKKNGLRGGK